MKERALAYLQQVRNLWDSFSRVKRLILVLLTSAVLLGTIATAVLESHVSYEYLFTDLSTEDAAGIVAKLDELKIPHRIEANGTAVLVPTERVHEVRLQLAAQGLPRGGGVGFELFDKSQFGSTEFEQQVNFRRALEGELSRTIATIGAVRSARVHLVLPERSVFVLRKETGSASVVLQLQPGRDFGKREVKAVVHLVASAVPGLTANRVSVVSADGSTLHRPSDGDGDASGVDDPLVERELEMARSLELRVQELLERIVGRGRADVRARLVLDSRVRERTEEHYNPASTALRSEHRTTDGPTAGAAGAGESGVPGSVSNLPEDADTPPSEDGEDFPSEEDYYLEAEKDKGGGRESWTRNWEIDRVTEKTKTPAGGIQRLSLAVLVDGVYEDVDGKQQYRARDDKELQQLVGLVKSAVGFEESRGDVVSIESARFITDDPAAEPVTQTPPIMPPWLRWYYVAIPTGVLLALGIAATTRKLRRMSRDAPQGMLALRGREAVVQLDTALGNAPGLPEHRIRAVDLDELRARAIEMAERDPDTASAILREWLNSTSTAHHGLSTAPIEVEG